jgi:quinol monooxygenase YgiN
VSEVVVVAVMRAYDGNEAEVEQGLREVAALTHGEEGCLLYAVHSAVDDRRRIVLVERWRSRADLDEHFTQPYVAALGEKAHLLAEPAQVFFLEARPAGDEVKGRL